MSTTSHVVKMWRNGDGNNSFIQGYNGTDHQAYLTLSADKGVYSNPLLPTLFKSNWGQNLVWKFVSWLVKSRFFIFITGWITLLPLPRRYRRDIVKESRPECPLLYLHAAYGYHMRNMYYIWMYNKSPVYNFNIKNTKKTI